MSTYVTKSKILLRQCRSGFYVHISFTYGGTLPQSTKSHVNATSLPQQPRVVTRTTPMGYGFSRSTIHQGDASFMVSVHLLPSCTVVLSPSFPLAAAPPRTVVDWFAGFRRATFVPAGT